MVLGAGIGILYLIGVLLALGHISLLAWLNSHPLVGFPIGALLGLILAFPGMWLVSKAYDLDNWLRGK